MRQWLLLAMLALPGTAPLAAATAPAMDCIAARPLPLSIRIGTAAPAHALLIGGSAPALRVVDADSGTTLWSAGTAAASQRFADMTAGFAGSLAAIDTDGDGLHDRLYAGDLAGRLWRFDLHNGAAANAWASGGVFADFSNTAGRLFLAPPDVSLAVDATQRWFNIAIGTAAPGRSGANNRFYLLRDHSPLTPWSDAQYQEWPPLQEADLLDASTTRPVAIPEGGWFMQLQGGDVLAPALTVAGRTVFAIAETTGPLTGCRSAFSVVSVDALHARMLGEDSGTWRRPLPGEHTLDSAFQLTLSAGGEVARALCSFGTEAVADCNVDLRAHRTWWRREDAE